MGKNRKSVQELILDGRRINDNPAAAFRGLGCVSANGTSRLLLDYKREHPAAYTEILRLLFQPGFGAGLSHLKIELGCDANTSSGTEPCIKRTPEEPADVTRGAGFILAADAKKINPRLTTELLRWSEPRWVRDAFSDGEEAGFSARYRWYYETLTAAYETLSLKFDYISPDANEPEQPDTRWITYFSERLHHEKNAPYDFSAIKIVACDEEGHRHIARAMRKDPALLDAVDVISLHYTTYGDENTRFLHDICGKEIWYGEGIAPCCIPELTCRVDGSGIGGINSVLDTANRIIGSYAHGRMVMYEFQPAAAALYDGSPYYPKSLLTANTPWSGHYTIQTGFWAAAHFTRFAETGWQHFDAACIGDGEEKHAIWNTTRNHQALVSPDRRYVTVHFCNDSPKPRLYRVILRNLPELVQTFYIILTAGGSTPEIQNKRRFFIREGIKPDQILGNSSIYVHVPSFSLLTLTNKKFSGLLPADILPGSVTAHPLSLPFRLSVDMPGHVPPYTTDQGGAFELEDGWLVQKITKDIRPIDWNGFRTPDPITSFGDDRWGNYRSSARIRLASDAGDNYAGIGMRYTSACICPKSSMSGLMLRLYGNGKWELLHMEECLESGAMPQFDHAATHRLTLIAVQTMAVAICDGITLCSHSFTDTAMVPSGRMALQSAYYCNAFSDIQASALLPSIPAFCRFIDCLSPSIRYPEDAENGWELHATAEYTFHNRTSALGTSGSVMECRFCGCGVFILGRTNGAKISLHIDGRLYSPAISVPASRCRESFCSVPSLKEGRHTLRMTILSGSIELDGLEIPVFSLTDSAAPERNNALKKMPSIWKKAAAVSLAAGAAAGIAAAAIKNKK